MAFRVETSAEAELEAKAILEWLLAQRAGDAGMQWFLRLERKPHLYRILFTVDGETGYVLHIRHGRRKPLRNLDKT